MKSPIKASQVHDKTNNNLMTSNNGIKTDTEMIKKRTSELKSQHKYISYQLSFTEKVQKVLESRVFLIIDIIMTLWMFYANDLKNLYTSKDSDVYFSIISLIVMGVLFIEIISLFIIDENEYGCSFYFWIDLIAMASMVLDLHFVTNETNIDVSPLSEINKNHTMSIIYISFRFRILARIIKFEKAIFSRLNNGETRFEKLLNQRVVTLFLLGTITSIFSNPNFYIKEKLDKNYELRYFEIAPPEKINVMFDIFKTQQELSPYPVLEAKIGPTFTYIDIDYDEKDYRKLELYIYDTKSDDENINKVHVVFDNTYTIHLLSKLNMLKTTINCLVLVLGMISFNYSTKILAIEPIKKMTQKVKNLSINPIAALQQNMDMDSKNVNQNKSGPLETNLLEKTVTKICGLLALGFGEAGAEIISTVLKEGVEADMNPMIPGKKIMAIYGFCDIRNFTDTTEVLQEKVMIFVNEVAEIVHEISAEYMGSANKNIGDAFLLVWKINPRYTKKVYDPKTKEVNLTLLNIREVNQIMDMALIAFIKIIIEIRRSKKLFIYSMNKELNERMPNYSVKLGFGLHVGYSIEGAIGSMFKIDASYLSPNVDMAGGIQEKTKDYGKELILSDQFVSYLSPETRKVVRQLDQFKDYKIYTVDMDLSDIYPEECKISKTKKENITDLDVKMRKIKEKRDKANERYNDVIHNKYNIWDKYKESLEFINVRRRYTDKFFEESNLGFQDYINGDWQSAKIHFEQAKKALNSDSKNEPSIDNLLKFMAKSDYKAGEDWHGYRLEGPGH